MGGGGGGGGGTDGERREDVQKNKQQGQECVCATCQGQECVCATCVQVCANNSCKLQFGVRYVSSVSEVTDDGRRPCLHTWVKDKVNGMCPCNGARGCGSCPYG